MAARGPGHSLRPDREPPSVCGPHQPGIATPQLDYLTLGAFDVAATGTAALRELLAAWSAEAERLMACERVGPDPVAAHGLTLTVGLGPRLFEAEGDGGFALHPAKPIALAALPAFDGDAIDPSISGGDLCVQACATQAHVASDAIRRLAQHAEGAAALRWIQDGFLRADAQRAGGSPRDLLGFKSGTNNVRRGRDFDRHVWVGDGDRSWMLGGTYLVVRRIRVRLAEWARLAPGRQERIIGRHKLSGAPLGGRREFDPLPLDATADGEPTLPLDSHARLASPRSNVGAAMLRRSYNYNNGPDADGERDAGLLFLSYQQDPRRQFVPVQRKLAEGDALSAYTRHVGSAVFAIPPGARPGGFIAEAMFERTAPAI